MAVVAVAIVAMLFFRPSAPNALIRTPVPIRADQALHPMGALFDISRDGSLVVYRRQTEDGTSELWVRSLAGSDAALIGGTMGAELPGISPDGREVAFTEAGSPARVRVATLQGGGSRTLADSAALGGVRWSRDGEWVYFTNANLGLSRVPAVGGSAEVLTRVDGSVDGQVHWGVEVLPEGGTILYTSSASGGTDPRIEALSLETGEVRDVWSGSFPRYSETGHLVFMDASEAVLQVAPFDVDELELVEAPVAVVDGLVRHGSWPLFSVSQTGTLLYARPLGVVSLAPVWVDRDGAARAVVPGWADRGQRTHSSLSLSPSDDRLALSLPGADGSWDLWVMSLGRSTEPLLRVTSDGALNYRPRWSPDGRSLRFISDRAGQPDLWTKAADGTGVAQRILDRPGVIRNASTSPDGAWLVFREGEAPVADILAVRADGTGGTVPVVATEFGERSPALSPDGRWIAYTSIESGDWQVWVTGFLTEDDGAWQVSPDGGEEPVWAHSGRELFYRNQANQLVSVQVLDGPAFALGRQEVLFSVEDYLESDGRPQYDVSADDERFLMLRLEGGGDVGLVRVDDAFQDVGRSPGN